MISFDRIQITFYERSMVTIVPVLYRFRHTAAILPTPPVFCTQLGLLRWNFSSFFKQKNGVFLSYHIVLIARISV